MITAETISDRETSPARIVIQQRDNNGQRRVSPDDNSESNMLAKSAEVSAPRLRRGAVGLEKCTLRYRSARNGTDLKATHTPPLQNSPNAAQLALPNLPGEGGGGETIK